jgi:hypothetical protein
MSKQLISVIVIVFFCAVYGTVCVKDFKGAILSGEKLIVSLPAKSVVLFIIE